MMTGNSFGRFRLFFALRLAWRPLSAVFTNRGIIHKNLKPGNILVKAASGEVWLTGFGISSRLARERQTSQPPEMIAGTLAYMAPEQTGRMNRSLDSRSDLYSCGVVLYELLTGSLPFAASDAMEWIHCHVARHATPPIERVNGVPDTLSAVVMKLLSKNAEDRYQTAADLEAGLRRCLAEWNSVGRIEPFPLGAHNVSDRLLIPEKLYGREREISTMVPAFDRVVNDGAPELILVSGYSGIGKSSVVNELRKAFIPPRGLYASGKFDRYKRDVPYATLAQAFQSLIKMILGQTESELGRWRNEIREALGVNGQIIVNLIPELELIIGKQPPLPELSFQEERNRFEAVFRRFIGVFAQPQHPLVLFLDDLQWLDAATLQLVEHLLGHDDVGHLLLLGAYRDNEVGPSHPLMRTLETIRKAKVRVQNIVLAPLAADDVSRLVADSFRCEPDRAEPLARLIHEKTDGNPFFAIQFLTALTEEGLVAFDRNARYCYLRWGTNSKVRQLDRTYPNLREEPATPGPTTTIGAPVEQVDLATVIKLSQAVSGEIVLDKLIDTLMRIALEHTGAGRGLLMLRRNGELRIEAEAATGRGGITVGLIGKSATPAELPDSVLNYVIRTRDGVILDDTSSQGMFSLDPYIVQRRARSILCLPLMKQAELIGVLYLENNVTSHVFTPAKVSVLKLLASQAAISLENAGLYADRQKENIERKRTETALRESEDRFRRMADTILEVIWVTALNPERVLYTSPSFERIWGLSVEALYRNPRLWTETIHPEDRDRVNSLFSKWIAGEAVSYHDVEFRIVQPSGAIRWIHQHGVVIRNEQGKPYRVSGISTDITERKWAEEAVRASKARFEGILEIAEDAIISIDADQRIMLFNQGAEKVFGYTKSEIIGSPLDRLLPQRFGNVHRKHIQEFAQSADVARTMGHRREVPGLRKDGSEFPAEASISKLDLGNEPVFTVILRDITERRRAVEELRRSEAYLAEAQRLSRTGSFGWNVASGEFIWSEETYRVVGLDRAIKPTLEHVLQRIHPEDLAFVRQSLDRAAREGTNLDIEHRFVMPDGSIKHVHVVAHAIKDEKGGLEYVGAVTEVTAAKIAFQQIQELKDQLQRENVALREEVDAVSMFEEIIGTSPALQKVLSRVSKVAPTDSTVLITGETGTGKELIARAIHKRSQRSSRAFVSVNCVATPPSLIASELFGHEKGAFTGALQAASDASSWRKAARFFSTKLASFRWRPRSRSCGFCKSMNSNASAAIKPFELRCA